MQAHTQVLEALDYYKVIEAVTRYCVASDSHQQFLAQRPMFNAVAVFDVHKKVRNFSVATSVRELPATHSFSSLFAFLAHIEKRELYIEEAIQLRIALETMQACHIWAHANEYSFFAQTHFPKSLYDTFIFYFDSKGALRSDNIPELSTIETKKSSFQKQRMKIAQTFMRANMSICQSDQATIRDNKLLIPIKSSFRSQVPGTIYTNSASFETVFIELYSIQNHNNEIEYLHYQEQKIIYDICRKISETLRRQLDTFRTFYEQFLDFDMIQAQYMYGKHIKGQLVQIPSIEKSTQQKQKYPHAYESTKKSIQYQEIFSVKLLGATHPLLAQSEPIDIHVPHNCKQLVITGANGGGKTFALKVLGLLVLMNQSGIPIPVQQPSELPVFSNIAMVIGDTQNIDTGLSTFTAHLQAIQNALHMVSDTAKKTEDERQYESTENAISVAHTQSAAPSLLLIDEICSDTDDREGGALAWAILEYLEQYDIYTVVTTHLALLKQYAISKETVEIASVEGGRGDDKHTIRYGVIGTSEAEKCAKQVGMISSIVQRQQALLNEYGKEYQEYLRKLQQYIVHWEQRNIQLDMLEKKLQRKQRELSQKEAVVHEKEESLLKDNYIQGTQLLQQLRKSVEQSQSLQNNLQNISEESSSTQKKVKELREVAKHAKQELGNMQMNLKQRQEKNSVVYFEVGATIHLKKNKANGTVIEVLANNYYIVHVGIIKMRVHASEMYIQQENTERSEEHYVHHSQFIVERSTIEQHFKKILDLRGNRVEEAIQRLERNIDMALLQKETSFSIIHGKGEGALRKAIHEYVAQHTAILRKEFGTPEEGGEGLTKIYIE